MSGHQKSYLRYPIFSKKLSRFEVSIKIMGTSLGNFLWGWSNATALQSMPVASGGLVTKAWWPTRVW